MEAHSPQGGQPPQPPGWYQNPEGPGLRWWDGGKWTDQYQQAAPQVAPPQQPKQKSNFMRNCLMITLGVLVGGALLIGGCVAVIGAGIEEADDEQRKKGITLSQFRSIQQGTTQSAVEADLGEPEDAQEFEQEIPEIQDQPSKSSCIYYPEKGKALFEGRSFQFCFDDGRLTSKNAY